MKTIMAFARACLLLKFNPDMNMKYSRLDLWSRKILNDKH